MPLLDIAPQQPHQSEVAAPTSLIIGDWGECIQSARPCLWLARCYLLHVNLVLFTIGKSRICECDLYPGLKCHRIASSNVHHGAPRAIEHWLLCFMINLTHISGEAPAGHACLCRQSSRHGPPTFLNATHCSKSGVVSSPSSECTRC